MSSPNLDLLSPVALIDWVLECGCEPCVEHCDQCDSRRKVRAVVEAKRAERQQVADLEARGYTVTPPQGATS